MAFKTKKRKNLELNPPEGHSFIVKGRMHYYNITSPESEYTYHINAPSEKIALERAKKTYKMKTPKIVGHSSYGAPGL